MSAAAFLPDPLLARAAPAPSRGGFDVQALLSPRVAGFMPDPILSRVQVQDMADTELDHPGGVSGLESGPEPAAAHDLMLTHADARPGASEQAVAWPQDLQALLEQRYREGFEEGMTEGARMGQEAGGDALQAGGAAEGVPMAHDGGLPVAQGARDVVLLLEALSRALQPMLLPDDAATRFEPLKRLALHLAMELVRTELTVSPKVVEALVRRSVQALQAGDQAPVVVELHPQDWALLRQALHDPALGLAPDDLLLKRVSWREDPNLTRGSVRARSDVSTVEDLIQNRLASIMHDLRIQSVQWQQDEGALQRGLSAEEAQGLEPDESAGPGHSDDGEPHA